MRRRDFLRVVPGTLAVSGLLAGCGTLMTAADPEWAGATILETATGRRLTVRELQDRLAAAPVALLGEQHDNPAHHRLRASLIPVWARQARPRPVAVVFEQLDRDRQTALREAQRARPSREETDEARVARLLEVAAFDREAWRWPLHEPLFRAAGRAGATWIAANFSRREARRLMRPAGESPSVDPTLAAIRDSARWDEAAAQALEAALRAGHCDRLPETALPGIAAAQRLRDAALAQPLLDANERRMLLIAGNGHVRRDFGVPRYLGAFEQSALVVGFEEGDGLPEGAAGLYDLVVMVTGPARAKPC